MYKVNSKLKSKEIKRNKGGREGRREGRKEGRNKRTKEGRKGEKKEGRERIKLGVNQINFY